MILGYLDREDRAYDVSFATLRLRIRVEAEPPQGTFVSFARIGDEGRVRYKVQGEVDVAASLAMDHDGDRVPLLRTVEGHLYRHERGILFIAAPRARDPEDPSFFLVNLRALPTAIRFFFEDQEGTELVSVPQDEILRVERTPEIVTCFVSAANIALPKEKLAYALELSPARVVAPLLGNESGPARTARRRSGRK